MFAIYIIIYNIFSTIHSHWQYGSQFSHEDCYESFTVPKIWLKLLHYNLSGPKFLHVLFQAGIKYANSSIKNFKYDETYDFKRIDGPCINPFIFSTQGMEIDKMEIVIKVYLPSAIINTIYTYLYFKNGFRQGEYVFMDQHSRFGIATNVIYSNEPFMPIILHIDINEVKNYLSLMTIDKKDICIITENNRQVSIRPYYHGEISKGFIVGIVYRFENIEYQAFECNANEAYRYEKIAFIFDKLPNTLRYLNAIYAQWNGEAFLRNEIQFSVFGINLYNVYRSPILPPNIKQVFFVKKRQISTRRLEEKKINLKDFIFYTSIDGTIYQANKYMTMEISPHVERELRIHYFTLALNEEIK